MKNKKMRMVLPLALAGVMTVSAAAVEPTAIPENEDLLTRGALVSLLYQRAGSPEVDGTPTFTDVSAGVQEADAVCWAADMGIVNGYGDGTFGPEDPVTREQMAVILYRCAQAEGQGFTGMWAFPLPYSDAGEVGAYAYEAVCWTTMKGVLDADDEGAFSPQSQVTWEQADAAVQALADCLEPVERPNPFVECATMAEAEQIAGFSMDRPEKVPNWVIDVTIRAADTGLIEVVYTGGQEELILRKGLGDGDISGDFNVYDETGLIEAAGHSVATRGQDGKSIVATWSDGAYAYAIRVTTGLEQAELTALVSWIQ